MSVRASVTSHEIEIRSDEAEDVAIYLRNLMLDEWERRKDYGAKEIADALTAGLAR